MTLRDRRVLQLRIMAELAMKCKFPGEEIEGLVDGLTAKEIAEGLLADRNEVLDELVALRDGGEQIASNQTPERITIWRLNWGADGNLYSNEFNDPILPEE